MSTVRHPYPSTRNLLVLSVKRGLIDMMPLSFFPHIFHKCMGDDIIIIERRYTKSYKKVMDYSVVLNIILAKLFNRLILNRLISIGHGIIYSSFYSGDRYI